MTIIARRRLLALSAFALTTAYPFLARSQAPQAFEIGIGSASAPLTVVKYHSLSCGVCQRFAVEVMPRIKADYVEKGLLRFVYRDFPLDRVALDAHALARCAGPERAAAFIAVLYREKESWAHASDPLPVLESVGLVGGVSRQMFAKCRSDETLVNAILQQRLDAARVHSVDSTPTFVIGDKVHVGFLSYEEFAKAVDAKLPRR
ncbi:MAG: DsbA family protein [Alphaproteobacteria bacterium]|nr:DsbA family protein [Alphaproteobacteria bacterium]